MSDHQDALKQSPEEIQVTRRTNLEKVFDLFPQENDADGTDLLHERIACLFTGSSALKDIPAINVMDIWASIKEEQNQGQLSILDYYKNQHRVLITPKLINGVISLRIDYRSTGQYTTVTLQGDDVFGSDFSLPSELEDNEEVVQRKEAAARITTFINELADQRKTAVRVLLSSLHLTPDTLMQPLHYHELRSLINTYKEDTHGTSRQQQIGILIEPILENDRQLRRFILRIAGRHIIVNLGNERDVWKGAQVEEVFER